MRVNFKASFYNLTENHKTVCNTHCETVGMIRMRQKETYRILLHWEKITWSVNKLKISVRHATSPDLLVAKYAKSI